MTSLDSLLNRLADCNLCPNHCACNRLENQSGICLSSSAPAIYQNFIHLGEEVSIIPAFVINMAGCSLDCPTCPEKHRFSQKLLNVGTPDHYANAMASYFLRKGMPKSIEWIGGEPSTQLHFVLLTSQILKKILPDCPTIYLNTNAYFDPDLIEYMHDIIDAFVFDLKCSESCLHIVGGFSAYYKTATQVILRAANEITGPHILRHLVMPGHFDCCTKPIIAWCRQNIPNVTFNLMTTFTDFRTNPDGPVQLPEDEAQIAILEAKNAHFPKLLINGRIP